MNRFIPTNIVRTQTHTRTISLQSASSNGKERELHFSIRRVLSPGLSESMFLLLHLLQNLYFIPKVFIEFQQNHHHYFQPPLSMFCFSILQRIMEIHSNTRTINCGYWNWSRGGGITEPIVICWYNFISSIWHTWIFR